MSPVVNKLIVLACLCALAFCYVEAIRCVGDLDNLDRNCNYPDECGLEGNCLPGTICNYGNCTVGADCCSGECIFVATRGMRCQSGSRAGCMNSWDCHTGCCNIPSGSEQGQCGYPVPGWGCMIL